MKMLSLRTPKLFIRPLIGSLAIVSAFAFLFICSRTVTPVTMAHGSAVQTVPDAPTATFAADAGSLGAIPDGTALSPLPSYGASRDVTFTVTGLSGAPSNVEVSFTIGAPVHTFRGDIEVTLKAPGGSPSFTLFSRTNATSATSFGSASDLTGPYNFKDSATNGAAWWTNAATPTTPGDYRTVTPGTSAATPAVTTMTPAFASVANPNGTWTLSFRDGCSADTGAVSAASLTITAATVPHDANADMNGDGKTDFVVARATSSPFADGKAPGMAPIRNNLMSDQENKHKIRSHEPVDASEIPLSPPIFWYTNINGTGATSVQQWGDAATDFIVTEDFDGDGKDDLAVWREAPANSAAFYVFQSSNNTAKIDLFGQTGDDPAVVGDYDGDGKADSAVYRCPAVAAPAGQCFFFYRGSSANPGGNVTYVPWGFGNDGDNFPYVGDFDGDGKNDFCIQRSNTAISGQGQFAMLKSTSGTEFINWGLDTDFLIPGDYDGDGKTDLCVRRSNTPSAGLRTYYILTRTGATSVIPFGITNDASVPGDYDGDGKTDIAIWRANVDPNQNFFWILNSSNGSVSSGQEWGQCPAGNCDFAVAGWAVH